MCRTRRQACASEPAIAVITIVENARILEFPADAPAVPAVAAVAEVRKRAVHAFPADRSGLDGLARDFAVVSVVVVVSRWRVVPGRVMEFDVEVQVVVFDKFLQGGRELGVVVCEIDGAVAGVDEEGGGVLDFDCLDDHGAVDCFF